MPIRYEIRDETIWFVTEGDVEYASGIGVLLQALDAARTLDPRRRWNALFDIRASRENRTADELEGIASLVAENDAVLSGRCVVVAGDTLHLGLARMFSAYAEESGLDVAVVNDLEAAVAFLAGETATG